MLRDATALLTHMRPVWLDVAEGVLHGRKGDDRGTIGSLGVQHPVFRIQFVVTDDGNAR